MRDMKDFWNNRVSKHGHTGWADKFIYAYDQKARLLAVQKVLDSLTCEKSLALDFGTGSGDFINLLLKYFKEVIAFDISDAVLEVAKERSIRTDGVRFCACNHVEEIRLDSSRTNLILSVTVLDHIIDDAELIRTLKCFQNILSEDGVVVALEYALDDKKPMTSYQRFMKFEEWISLFQDNGFCLYRDYKFYHPIESPCESYLSYKRHTTGIRGSLLKSLDIINPKLVNRRLDKTAEKCLQEKDDFFWDDDRRQSPIRIMIFQKQK